MSSDIRRTQDTIMDLRRRHHDAHMSTIAASTAIQNHEAEPATSSLTPSTADEMLRADPVTVDTQALDDAEHHQPLATVPDGAAVAAATVTTSGGVGAGVGTLTPPRLMSFRAPPLLPPLRFPLELVFFVRRLFVFIAVFVRVCLIVVNTRAIVGWSPSWPCRLSRPRFRISAPLAHLQGVQVSVCQV